MSKTEFTASANVRVTVEVQNIGPVCQHCGKERANGAGRFAIVEEPEVVIVSQRRVRP